MKFFLLICIIAVASAFAQVGSVRSVSGIHAASAKILPQGFLFVSGNFEMVSDGKPLGLGGFYFEENEKVKLDKNIPSNEESFFASFSILDNLEFNFRLPFYYEGKINETDLEGMAFGDAQFMLKTYIPLNQYFHLGLSGEIIAPTGEKNKGFRPRHRWYINHSGEAYAYTADSWSFDANFYLTIDFGDALMINSYLGMLKTITFNDNYLLWGLGLNIFPKALVTLILEVSGESPLYDADESYSFFSNPLRLTPALRVHLPKETYLTISSDIGIHYLKKTSGIPVHLKSKNLKFNTAGNPEISIAISLSKAFDFSWKDNDNDGVIDRFDLCPTTAMGLKVNSRGCPVDEDQDGILNIVDACPGTPANVEVDFNGCPLDLDKDGVFDYKDNCLDTPEGFAVDSVGCTLDSDFDGVDDNHDKCPMSKIGEKVGENGCPLDEDGDGVLNEFDECPHTPLGLSVDEFGCPMDFDGDGIPDELDKCPHSRLGEAIDSLGCPLDSDKDGVSDSKDECENTPENVKVNEKGCRLDSDFDGIFDEEDKCPFTPKGAPVDSTGCPLDEDLDGVPDYLDKCPGTFLHTEVDNNGCPLNQRLNFNLIAQRIKFKDDSTFVNSSYTALNDIIYVMRQNVMTLEIEAFSLEQAETIYKYLHLKGINENRLRFKKILQRKIRLIPKAQEKFDEEEPSK